MIGAEVTFAHQNIQTYKYEKQEGNISYRHREFLSLLILTLIAKHYHEAKPPVTAPYLLHTLTVPIRVINDILYQLEQGGFIIDIGTNDTRTYIPARPLDHITVCSVLEYLHHQGQREIAIHESLEKNRIESLVKKLDDSITHAYGDLTLQQVVQDLSQGAEMISLRPPR